MMKALLKVENLSAHYIVKEGTIKAANNINLEIAENSVTAVVGESASGKSTLIEAITMSLPPNGRISSGKVFYKDNDILKSDYEHLRKIRWTEIAYVPQAAQQSLNPTMKVIDHFVDTVKSHNIKWSNHEIRERASELLKLVRLEPGTVLDSFPNQLSGGMKQRVLIALALLFDPKILILDEPTSALDVITQAHIVKLLKEIKKNRDITIIFITHDIAIAAELADYIVVIYGGHVIEKADTIKIFKEPKHPYTKGLINSIMSILSKDDEPKGIKGDPPSLLNPPPGCKFHPRCQFASEICKKEVPDLIKLDDSSKVACFLYKSAGGDVDE
ncbi:Oligopeptide transport ATP-binding protein OppD (TC 3.A.1.5.1) [Caloramator australicus RC3]|uniref:Oligopeptide transport ATP-binding protein OppD (TC 3.A.1.5.1) n=2 Tax=Caloramator TaxID=44258 RepID=I7KTR3_9CLOT|nr:Oligopeptide transport ATP-binding protein OppD (TC 3.A.1.5.1) [Caloramator australicus RC3]